MTIDRFMVFAAVAKHRNATRASEELHLSQPAVTKQLKLLEKNYNTKLFVRAGKGMELTDEGRVFLRDVKTILERYKTLRHKFSAARSESAQQTLTVGGSYSPSVYLLPSLLALFKKTHPQVQLDLRTNNRTAIEKMVLNSEVDIAVINNVTSHPMLASELYRQESLVAFVARNHPLTKKRQVSWQDFERTPLVIRQPVGDRGTAEQIIREMTMQGLKPNIVLRCETPQSLKTAVASKMGVGILFRETIEPEAKNGQFKLIKLPPANFRGESFIIYRKDRPLSACARDFLNLLRQRRQRLTGDRKRNARPAKHVT